MQCRLMFTCYIYRQKLASIITNAVQHKVKRTLCTFNWRHLRIWDKICGWIYSVHEYTWGHVSEALMMRPATGPVAGRIIKTRTRGCKPL